MKRILLLIILAVAIGCEIEIENGNGTTQPKPSTNTQQPSDQGEYSPPKEADPNNGYDDPESDEPTGFGVSKIHGKNIKQTWLGKVVKITDGDTITVLKDNEQIKVRLESIDTPERKQPFGTVAKDALAAMVHEKPVTIYETGKDRYGRSLGFVVVGDLDVCHEMVWQGFAWNYTQYSKSERMAASEQEARAAGRGLWAGRGPDDQVPPWEWRRR